MAIKYLDGGYCRQLLASVDGRSWRVVRFHAAFLAVKHPTEGWVIIDTGYGNQFFAASRRWPYLLYRLATPATMAGSAAATLREAGIDPADVRHVIITHFHADHVGGVADFPSATFSYHADALTCLANLSPLRQTRAAFLPDLLPESFAHRSQVLAPSQFCVQPDLVFRQFNLFGDGRIKLVDLPGHAPGHLGVLFNLAPRPLLYVSDAYWRTEQLTSTRELPLVTRKLQWNYPAYRQTLQALGQIQRENRYRLLSCHSVEMEQEIHPLRLD
jgi:glyoxylase-like metal-dependent hydrolase (beta-lactamase superfamily II)